VQIIPDHKSEKLTTIGAWLTKLSQKQFSLTIYGMSVISNVSNLTRYGDDIVKCFNIFNSEKTTKIT